MFKIFIMSVWLLLCQKLNAQINITSQDSTTQESKKNDSVIQKDSSRTSDTTEALTFVEVMPVFPGGQDAMLKFIATHTIYPSEAIEKNIQGKVYVRFIVKSDGSVRNIAVIRGVHASLDAEAVRVVQSMPNWIPAQQNGKPVNVQFTLPINFSLK